ncbi:Heat stress transcription factor [Seminavis robusta]|uniref:Heat stress transcription factor n=1 Tax=Seminavis robusta TaxID=568900 RepID=A0A9N8EEK6_9STRA|nr:Heat stress transcription factor [Seminavis robusta]|eukprot:Sro1068_g237470.1 Heat stress transcription factor (401) ;mRNA; r:14225-15778
MVKPARDELPTMEPTKTNAAASSTKNEGSVVKERTLKVDGETGEPTIKSFGSNDSGAASTNEHIKESAQGDEDVKPSPKKADEGTGQRKSIQSNTHPLTSSQPSEGAILTGQAPLNPSCHYTDASLLADPTPDKRRNRGGVSQAFPDKLHKLLDQVEADGLGHVISWQPHGRCFVVHKPKVFVDLLPKYFQQSKLTSFQRQLNLYGFRRISQGADSGGYYHELFLRGRSGLSANMKRTKIKGTVKQKRDPSTEPDFYKYPPLGNSSNAAEASTNPPVAAAGTGVGAVQSLKPLTGGSQSTGVAQVSLPMPPLQSMTRSIPIQQLYGGLLGAAQLTAYPGLLASLAAKPDPSGGLGLQSGGAPSVAPAPGNTSAQDMRTTLAALLTAQMARGSEDERSTSI